MSDSHNPAMRITLLGQFEVRRGEQTVAASDWTRRKAAALLQRIALEKRLLRDEALEFLWPDTDPTSAANNLYRTLYSLRKTLDDALGEGTAETTFSYNDGVLRLDDDVWVDVHAFEELSRQKDATEETLERALDLYQGQLLPDSVYDDWTAAPRQTLHHLYRDTCLRLAEQVTDVRAIEATVSRLRPLLEEDPADEVIHRQLMRLFALIGHRHDALRQYQACVEALEEELGVTPMPETRALHEQILSGEIRVRSTTPAARHASRQPAPPAPARAQQSALAPLVGRQPELGALMVQLEAVAEGQGSTVLIRGATGVGKTRLAKEVLQTASSQGMSVLRGAAYEYEGQLAYQPFAEAIDRYLAEAGRGAGENPLTHFRPESGDPQQDKWALFNSTGAFLSNLAAETPLILFLDDLHAADEASLQLFHYLARHTRSRPFLLLATYRTDIVQDPASPFGSLLNSLYREGLRETISLEPLAPEAIADMVRHFHGGDVDATLTETIFEATEGNPFFVEEMCHAVRQSQQVVQEDGEWRLKAGAALTVPSDLRELLRERIAQSGPEVATAVEMAAVIGHSFGFEILRRVTILTEGDLINALDAALQAGFIEEVEDGYQFRHRLTHQALYQAQSKPRRQRLHTLTAAAIEEASRRSSKGLEAHVEALAHHYGRSDRRERALPYLIQAGKRAADLYAFEGAIDYYERALALMDELAIEDEDNERWRLLEALGWWEKVLANNPRAVSRFDEALAAGEAARRRPKPSDRARMHAGAAMALLTAGNTTGAEEHLDAAREEIDEEEYASEYADILYNVAQLHWHRNEYEQAFEVAQRSLDIAEKLDDEILVARAFEMLALACHSLGEWQLGLTFEEKRSAIAGPELDVTDAFDVHL
ncbi:MAG TPA: BREX system ATP-binding domain-containing protein [Candidatus Sulfomarinibacteraceae bacterium]|nr:BREX system ATP-binding domain-containing protein [Candidatus Sulfomarinibacteraceae bacterium]